MKKSTLICLISAITIVSAQAQVRVGLNFDTYKPVGGFGENLDNSPAGISLTGLYTLRNERFTIGTDIGAAMYASRSYDYELKGEDSNSQIIEIKEEDCFLHMDALVRYTFYQDNLIQAFAEAKTGFYTFFSDRWTDDKYPGFKDKTEFHGTSIITGIGGGISLNLTNLFNKGTSSTNPIFLDFSTSYNSGTRASYRHITNEDRALNNLNEGNYSSVINSINTRVGFSIQL